MQTLSVHIQESFNENKENQQPFSENFNDDKEVVNGAESVEE
jgi:hypothetical protein